MAHEPGTLRGEDPEQLHQMRVAHRRLRVALTGFEPVLPPALVAAEPELQWVGHELGPVRDLDVQIEAMSDAVRKLEASPETIEALLSAAREERERARTRMLDALTGARFEALVLQVARCLREQVTAEGAGAGPTIAELAPGMLDAQYSRFRKAAMGLKPGSNPAELHKARRRSRKLRYATEFVEAVYEAPATDLIAALKQLQDVLGEHQDRYAAIQLRRRIRKSLSQPAQQLVDELDKEDRRRAKSLRRAAPDAVKDVKKRWKALEKTLRP